MPILISNSFLFEIVHKSLRKINTRLIGNRDCNPQQIGKLIGKVGCFTLFKRLISIPASHDARHFSCFFGKNSHIGERREVSHSDCFNPVINRLLRVSQCYVIVVAHSFR